MWTVKIKLIQNTGKCAGICLLNTDIFGRQTLELKLL